MVPGVYIAKMKTIRPSKYIYGFSGLAGRKGSAVSITVTADVQLPEHS